MTVRTLLSHIDSHELSEWLAFAVVTGDLDPHYGSARISHTVASVHGAKGLRIADFYPASLRPPTQSGAEIKAMMQTWSSGVSARAKATRKDE